MAGKVKDFTDANFTESTKTGVALVDFWAPWCPPCRAQGPIVEKLAESIGDDVIVTKVNVDENAEVASKFGVSSIPTLVVLKDGREAKRFVGLQQEDALRSAIDSAKA